MDDNGFSDVRIIGYDHNWNDAGGYPIQLVSGVTACTDSAAVCIWTDRHVAAEQMEQAPNAFAGVAFHCYSGDVEDQDTFHTAYPGKEIYFTECTGTYGSDWWSDIKVSTLCFFWLMECSRLTQLRQWYMDNL